MFSSVLNGGLSGYLLSLAASIIAGLILALVYRKVEYASRSFSTTVALLPAAVMLVIMLVNGNIGVGVAVAGSFALVRFRSIPGKASDILIVFMAMGIGLCTGMGYIYVALCAAAIGALLYFIYARTNIFEEDHTIRSLRITIPEELDYTSAFDDIFEEYTKSCVIESVKTANLGTMFQINYRIQLKDIEDEKKMIDAVRTRNGNLPVISSTYTLPVTEL